MPADGEAVLMILRVVPLSSTVVTQQLVRNANSQKSQIYPRPAESETREDWACNLCFNKFSVWFRCLLQVESNGAMYRSSVA